MGHEPRGQAPTLSLRNPCLQDFWNGDETMVARPPAYHLGASGPHRQQGPFQPPGAQMGALSNPLPPPSRHTVVSKRPITSRGGLGGSGRLPPATPRSSGEEVGKILQGLGKVPSGGGEGAQRGIPAVAPQANLEEAATRPQLQGRGMIRLLLGEVVLGARGGPGPASPETSLGMDCG